jgi:glc operon protein GlcG
MEDPMNARPFLLLLLDDVKRIAAAEAEALAHQWAVSIAVVVDGGHLLRLQRLDRAAPISAQIAPNKARIAALGRRESRQYEEIGATSIIRGFVFIHPAQRISR